MAQVHRVTLLNKPLKIRGYSILQWTLLILSAASAFALGSYVPKQFKLGNLPLGILVGIGVFSMAIVLIHMSELKPWIWWKNQIMYRLGMRVTKFLPHPEPAQEYPDSSIIEPARQQDKYYVQQESGKK